MDIARRNIPLDSVWNHFSDMLTSRILTAAEPVVWSIRYLDDVGFLSHVVSVKWAGIKVRRSDHDGGMDYRPLS